MMSSKTLRLLLIEDDPALAQVIQKAMQRLGTSYQLDLAMSAEEGHKLWHQQPYDVLLTDYNLRGMSGLALITQLRQEGATAPMVLFTAYDTPELRQATQHAGATAYIPKPFFVDQFISLIRSLLPPSQLTQRERGE